MYFVANLCHKNTSFGKKKLAMKIKIGSNLSL